MKIRRKMLTLLSSLLMFMTMGAVIKNSVTRREIYNSEIGTEVEMVKAVDVIVQEESVEIVQEENSEEKEEESVVYLGRFFLTCYCPCELCSEGWGHKTATGAYATEFRTVAVDPSVIPYGTHLLINGFEFIAEDCGGAIGGNHIDIFREHHEDCFDEEWNGWADVYIIKRG